MYFEHRDGSVTWYDEVGNSDRETVILIHGLGMDNHVWYPQKERYPEEGFYLLSYDLLGHGKSGDLEGANAQLWVDQLHDLMDAEKIEKAILIGIELGGLIALQFALSHSERVDRLVVCDSIGDFSSASDKLQAKKRMALLQLSKIRGEKALIQSLTSPYRYPYEDPTVHYLSKQLGRLRIDQLLLAGKYMNSVNLPSELSEISARTLVLSGADMGSWYERGGKKIADSLNWSSFKVVRRTRNPSNLVNPENFDAAVLPFLKSY